MNAAQQSVRFFTLMSAKQMRTRDVYVDSCLRVEHHRYFLAVKGTPVKLTHTEFRIVSCLVSNIDQIVTLQDLWNSAWDATKPLNRKGIHVFISRVRRKLVPFGLRIDSVVDVGYIFSHDRCCATASSEQLHG